MKSTFKTSAVQRQAPQDGVTNRQDLLYFLNEYGQQPERRCQRLVMGARFDDGTWADLKAELVTAGLINQEGGSLALAPGANLTLPKHKRDASIYGFARQLAAVYFDARLLVASWQEAELEALLADINFILEMLAGFSYGFALNAPGLRQLRQDVVRLRQLMQEKLAPWFATQPSAGKLWQRLQFWAAIYEIAALARSAAAAQLAEHQLCLTLHWHKQCGSVAKLALGQSGSLLAVADPAGQISVFAPAEDKLLLQAANPGQTITALTFAAADLFVLRADNQMVRYGVTGFSEAKSEGSARAFSQDVVVARQQGQILAHALNGSAATELQFEGQLLAMAVQGRTVAAADESGQVFVWEVEQSEKLRQPISA